MSFAREGLVFIGICMAFAAAALTAAVMWRSWPRTSFAIPNGADSAVTASSLPLQMAAS